MDIMPFIFQYPYNSFSFVNNFVNQKKKFSFRVFSNVFANQPYGILYYNKRKV